MFRRGAEFPDEHPGLEGEAPLVGIMRIQDAAGELSQFLFYPLKILTGL